MKNKFEEICDANPSLSSLMCFVKLVFNKGYSKNIVRKYFNMLVDKEDYARPEKESVLKWLYGVGLK